VFTNRILPGLPAITSGPASTSALDSAGRGQAATIGEGVLKFARCTWVPLSG